MKFSTAFFALLSLASSANGFNLYKPVAADKLKLDQPAFLKFLEESAVDHMKLREDPGYYLSHDVEVLRRKSSDLAKELESNKEWSAAKRVEALSRRATLATEYYGSPSSKLHP